MKKVKFMVITLCVAALIMGAGYAAWTDTTVVTGTVDTGTMDVRIVWANLSTPDYTEGPDPVISEDGKSVTFEVHDLYPTVYKSSGEGAGQTFSRLHFSIENRGTVPVKIDNIQLTRRKPNSPVWDWLRTRVHIHAGIPSKPGGTSLTTTDNLMGSPNALKGDLKDLDTILMASPQNPNYKVLNEYVLEPGHAIWFGGNDEDTSSIRFFLDPEAPNRTQDKDISFTLTFNWKQFNM